MFKGCRQSEFVIDLEATDRGEIIALSVKEEAFKECRCTPDGRGITGSETTINLDNRILRGIDAVLQQSFAQVRTDIEIVDKENLDLADFAGADAGEFIGGNLLITLQQQFAGRGIGNIGGSDFTQDFVFINIDDLDALSASFFIAALVNFRFALTMTSPSLAMTSAAERCPARSSMLTRLR